MHCRQTAGRQRRFGPTNIELHDKAGSWATTGASKSARTQKITTDHEQRRMPVFAFARHTQANKPHSRMFTFEFAIRDGIPYAIDFCNPAPDADIHSVGQENFDWIVENASKMAIERAIEQVDGKNNCTWGNYVSNAAIPAIPIKAHAKKAPAKKK
jgi:hypothetical protein